MNNNRRLITSALEMLIGAALIVFVKLTDGDSVWLGMGGALIAVGTLQLLNLMRYREDAEYREKVDTEAHDERNIFIRSMAWVWAGSMFVIVGGVLTIVFLILGKQELSTIPGFAVGMLVLFYWISYLILRKKY